MLKFSDRSLGCCQSSFSNPLCAVADRFARSENDITDIIENTFSAEDDRFGEAVTVDLKPNGQNIPVTNENKKEYIESVLSCDLSRNIALIFGCSLITEWRIQKRVEAQFKAFLSGFNELVPQELINGSSFVSFLIFDD